MIEIGTYWRHKIFPQSPIKIINIISRSGINNDIGFIWAGIKYYCYKENFLESFIYDEKLTNEMTIKEIIE